MRNKFLIHIVVFCMVLAGGCASVPSGAEPLVIPGTGDSQDILRDLAGAYMAKYPQQEVSIPDSIGSYGGIEKVGIGEYSVGRSARRQKPEELKKFGQLQYIDFARVTISFVINKDVVLKNLSAAQICAVFSGQVTNWQQVGGNDLLIKVQSRPAGSNLLNIQKNIPCFRKLVFANNAHFNQRNSHLVESIKKQSGAIGFMPSSEAKLYDIKTINLNDLHYLDKHYPLGIVLSLIHKQRLPDNIQAFVDYLFTDSAKKIMIEAGYSPL